MQRKTRISLPTLALFALTTLVPDGTYSVSHGNDLEPETRSSGFWVSLPEHSQTFTGSPTTSDVLSFYHAYRDRDVPFVGVWTDDRTGTTYLDFATWVDNLEDAIRLGRDYGQISIWDIAGNRAIRTGKGVTL